MMVVETGVMKAYFSPCGIGLGHAGRCIPVAKKLRQNGAHVFFSTYMDGIQIVQNEDFPVVEVPSIRFATNHDGSMDFRKTAVDQISFSSTIALFQQVEAEIELMKTYRPNVIVSDSRVSPLIAAKLLRIPRLCILNQFRIIFPRDAGFPRLAKWAELTSLLVIGKIWTTGTSVLVPDFPPPYTLSEENLRIPRRYQKYVSIIGPLLPVLPGELSCPKDLREKLGLNQEKPLIFAPISGPWKERIYLIGMLRRIFNKFSDEYQIVMSLGCPGKSVKTVRNENFAEYTWIVNRFEHLKACDLVIARASHGTLTQSISYGKPIIVIPTPNQTEQHCNAKKAVKLGLAMLIDQHKLNKATLESKVQLILRKKLFQETSEHIQKEIVGENGVETAVKTITEVSQARAR